MITRKGSRDRKGEGWQHGTPILDTCHHTLAKPTERTAPRVHPKVSYGLRVNYDGKHSSLVGNVPF